MGKWYARCTYERRDHNSGYCETEEEAARAYDALAVAWFGEFARPNFPREWPPDRRAQVYAASAQQREEEDKGKGKSKKAKASRAKSTAKGKKVKNKGLTCPTDGGREGQERARPKPLKTRALRLAPKPARSEGEWDAKIAKANHSVVT